MGAGLTCFWTCSQKVCLVLPPGLCCEAGSPHPAEATGSRAQQPSSDASLTQHHRLEALRDDTFPSILCELSLWTASRSWLLPSRHEEPDGPHPAAWQPCPRPTRAQPLVLPRGAAASLGSFS